MRRRHKLGSRTLSMSQMSQDAGLSINAIQQIITGRTGASPTTLKQICDKWGNDDDFRRLMVLAGHPLPDDGWDELRDIFDDLPPEQREQIRRYAQNLLDNQDVENGTLQLAPAPAAA
ncbi:MAG: hypothetical protein GTO41_00335 [Burkholderiales bacterium]|nr:hypothetical protein [Burkholderiales bacterium]